MPSWKPRRTCHVCRKPTGLAGARKCKECGRWQCPECARDAADRSTFDDGWCIKCNSTWATFQQGRRGPHKLRVGVFGLWVYAEPIRRAEWIPGTEPRQEMKHRRGREPGTSERQYNGRTA